MKSKIYIIFYSDGKFFGFYNDENVVDSVLETNEDLRCVEITSDIHTYIRSNLFDIKQPILDVVSLENIKIIDDVKYILKQEVKKKSIQTIKQSIITRIKSQCGDFINSGLYINLSSGDNKLFSFKIEDQINLKDLVDNYKDQNIYYHADGEFDVLYSYEDITHIYKTLYNNKIYNQFYTQALCEWIQTSYTEEMHNSKEYVIDYGYINDEIITILEEKYEQYKLL